MKIVDLNLLLYAINRDAPHHKEARQWWESSLSDSETVGLPWIVVLGFVRISSHLKIMPNPLSPKQALDQEGRVNFLGGQYICPLASTLTGSEELRFLRLKPID